MKKFLKSIKRLSKAKKILLSLLLSIILLVGFGIGYSQYLLSKTSKQIPDLERTIDKYITYQANGEYKKAYNLFTEEYKNYEDLDAFIKKSDYIKPGVIDYMPNSLLKEDFFINFLIGQPISLRYEGYFSYTDRKYGKITAIFILKNKKWELLSVNITAPKSRLDKYSPPEEKVTQ